MIETARPPRFLVTGGRGKIGARVAGRLVRAGHATMVTDLLASRYGAASPAG